MNRFICRSRYSEEGSSTLSKISAFSHTLDPYLLVMKGGYAEAQM
jgi:hypothetical protein